MKRKTSLVLAFGLKAAHKMTNGPKFQYPSSSYKGRLTDGLLKCLDMTAGFYCKHFDDKDL